MVHAQERVMAHFSLLFRIRRCRFLSQEASTSAGQEKEEEDNEDIRMKRTDRICHPLSRVNGTQDAEVALSAVCDLIHHPALA